MCEVMAFWETAPTIADQVPSVRGGGERGAFAQVLILEQDPGREALWVVDGLEVGHQHVGQFGRSGKER